MRLKIAVPLIVLGLVLALVGIGQRTFWAPPETLSATVPAGTEAGPVAVIEPAVKDAAEDIDITVRGEGAFMLAMGRAGDVEAWVGDAAHLSIEGVQDEQLRTSFTDGVRQVPDPRGSDLWVNEENAEDEATVHWEEPADGEWSLLLAADGTNPAPADVTVSWANDRTTPFAVPLIIIGALLAIFGLAMLFVKRGPGSRTAAGSAAGMAVLGLASAVGLSGLGAPEATAALPASDTAQPSPEGSGASGGESTHAVLLEGQLARILASVADTVQAADAAGDAGALAPRVTGSALAVRTANYEVRTKDADAAPPVPIAAEPVLTSFVTSTSTWPRTVIAVTRGETNPVPQALTLVQGGPREDYKLTGAVQMLPGNTFPQPSTETGGTTTLDPASAEGLKVSPQEAVAGVGKVLVNTADPFAQSLAPNTFVEQIAQFQRDQAAANQNASITFSHTPETARTRALRTGDGGALVFGYLHNVMASVPAQPGATISLDEDYAVQAGSASTTTGVDIVFGESLVLYVPPAGSADNVQVVGATQELLDVILK